MWCCTRMEQYIDKLKMLKKYKEVVDGLHCSGVSVESNDDTTEKGRTGFPPRQLGAANTPPQALHTTSTAFAALTT